KLTSVSVGVFRLRGTLWQAVLREGFSEALNLRQRALAAAACRPTKKRGDRCHGGAAACVTARVARPNHSAASPSEPSAASPSEPAFLPRGFLDACRPSMWPRPSAPGGPFQGPPTFSAVSSIGPTGPTFSRKDHRFVAIK